MFLLIQIVIIAGAVIFAAALIYEMTFYEGFGLGQALQLICIVGLGVMPCLWQEFHVFCLVPPAILGWFFVLYGICELCGCPMK
jgi:hypothetical protein